MSWISSWCRGGSAASRAASGCGSRASRTATLFTTRWYGAAPGRGIPRKAEPAAATPGGGAGRFPAARCDRRSEPGIRPGARCAGAASPGHHDGMDFTTSARPGPSRLPDRRARRPALTPAPRAGIALIAVAAVAVEMAVSARYGYVRDELYFLSAGQHLAFGYVDQPPLTPLLARIAAALTGDTLAGFRILPALCPGRAGGDDGGDEPSPRRGPHRPAARRARRRDLRGVPRRHARADHHDTRLRILGVRSCCWSCSSWPARIRRWWLAIGGCAGVASEAKWNIAFLLAGLAAGFLLTDARRLLASRYLLIGGLLAAALAAPDVDLAGRARLARPGRVPRAADARPGTTGPVFWPAQILYIGPVLTPVWVGGAVWSLRSAAARPFRPAGDRLRDRDRLQFVLGGKAYYPGAAFTLPARGRLRPARAAASARAERPGPPGSWQAAAPPAFAAGTAMVAGAVLAAPVALPVLPARALHTVPLQKINYDLGEEIAWPPLGGAGRTAVPARCRPRSGRGPRSWPGTTARRERSTATAPATACRRSTAAPTTSGSGARRPPPTPRRSR